MIKINLKITKFNNFKIAFSRLLYFIVFFVGVHFVPQFLGYFLLILEELEAFSDIKFLPYYWYNANLYKLYSVNVSSRLQL